MRRVLVALVVNKIRGTFSSVSVKASIKQIERENTNSDRDSEKLKEKKHRIEDAVMYSPIDSLCGTPLPALLCSL